MKGRKVQSLRSLREEMKAVARGKGPAPADAGEPSFNSVEAIGSRRSPSSRTASRRKSRGKPSRWGFRLDFRGLGRRIDD